MRRAQRSTLFPYTTLFRSMLLQKAVKVRTDILEMVAEAKSGHPGGSLSAVEVLRSEEHTSELQSRLHLVCRLLLEKKNTPPRAAHIRPSSSASAGLSLIDL